MDRPGDAIGADARSPDVSVVVPTRNRPDLATRAVHNALTQAHRAIEVIVVVDGSDPATEEALAAIGDDRLRVVAAHPPVAEPAGPAEQEAVPVATAARTGLVAPVRAGRQSGVVHGRSSTTCGRNCRTA